MARVIKTNSDVEIDNRYGKTVTYEATGANEFIVEERITARATAGSPLSAGAIEILESERLTDRDAPIQEFRITVFIPNETIVQRLGAERAKDGLRELGILGDR